LIPKSVEFDIVGELFVILTPFLSHILVTPSKMTLLNRGDWQSFLERAGKRLATWKGNALSRGERLILVNSV